MIAKVYFSPRMDIESEVVMHVSGDTHTFTTYVDQEHTLRQLRRAFTRERWMNLLTLIDTDIKIVHMTTPNECRVCGSANIRKFPDGSWHCEKCREMGRTW